MGREPTMIDVGEVGREDARVFARERERERER